ncbi:MAG: hypothetical protein SV377_03735 [Halobacteria archaeon]|nr:hypothetical protein [Halobacteria archaeon]
METRETYYRCMRCGRVMEEPKPARPRTVEYTCSVCERRTPHEVTSG